METFTTFDPDIDGLLDLHEALSKLLTTWAYAVVELRRTGDEDAADTLYAAAQDLIYVTEQFEIELPLPPGEE